MGDNTFVLAVDGWVQVTPCGEFPHAGAGVVQVIDRAACDGIAAEFNARKADANFPGVLVDFDHFSLDTAQSSEAAGWITELESRDTGLWVRVRWSDAGIARAGRTLPPHEPGLSSSLGVRGSGWRQDPSELSRERRADERTQHQRREADCQQGACRQPWRGEEIPVDVGQSPQR